MKFGNIEISDWCVRSGAWVKYVERKSSGMIYHGNCVVMLYMKDNKVKHIRFYDILFQLDQLYNPDNIFLDWHVDFAKNSVDRFLIKMNGLTAFL